MRDYSLIRGVRTFVVLVLLGTLVQAVGNAALPSGTIVYMILSAVLALTGSFALGKSVPQGSLLLATLVCGVTGFAYWYSNYFYLEWLLISALRIEDDTSFTWLMSPYVWLSPLFAILAAVVGAIGCFVVRRV